MQELAIIEDGAVGISDGRIAWVGKTTDLPQAENVRILDASGQTVLPGFIDSHTHLVFAGSREAEFEQRLQGRTYQEIAASGGGINATVHKVVDCIREFVPDVQLSFVNSPIMNQLSYEVSCARFLAHGFSFTGDLRRGIGETMALLETANRV